MTLKIAVFAPMPERERDDGDEDEARARGAASAARGGCRERRTCNLLNASG